MVGTLQRDNQVFALIRTPEKDLYQVRPGNHLGQNYGVVLGVTDSEVRLKELIQDGSGDWTERSSTLQIQEKTQERK
jgi:type IV pilus assembly protein PilP